VTQNFSKSNAHSRAAHALIPGGAHTYAKGDDQYPEDMAPIIDRGAGCRVWDIDGNEFVEFGNGLRSATLGHGFEPVVRAVRDNIGGGINFVRPHRMELKAAERMVDLIPSAEMVKFGINGSDATTAAVRLARAYTNREMVATCRQHPFLSVDDWFITSTPMSAGIPKATERLTVQFNYNDLGDLARLFETFPGEIAAVVMEAETVEPPTVGYFAGLRSLCDKHGALLILDEIITGFRWHERGAQFVYNIKPDLCVFGKGLGNGFPVSALAGRAEIMRLGGFVDDADRVFLLSQTAGGQPWALAAMLAVINTYQEESIAERLHRVGSELRRGIEQVVAEAGLSAHFQLKGRDCNIVYAALDAEGRPSQDFRTLVLQEFIERGILAPSFIVCAAHDQKAIDHAINAVSELMPIYQRALEDGLSGLLRGRSVRPAIRARG
jgi:glutamate-1-semialdehyde 2,1-aminomutase